MRYGVDICAAIGVLGDVANALDNNDIDGAGWETETVAVGGEGVEEGIASCVRGLTWAAVNAGAGG